MKTIQVHIPNHLEKLIGTMPIDITKEAFIIDAIIEKIKKISPPFRKHNNKKLENLLAQGYKLSHREVKMLNREFKNIDEENWDEY